MFLHVDQLSVQYPGAARARVRHVSLALERGQIGALLGPSGCGKTSLLRAVAGLERPVRGRVVLEGDAVSDAAAGGVRLTADVQVNGKHHVVAGEGTGPIDAFVRGLNDATGQSIRGLDYHEHAVGAGANARAVAYLELRVNSQTLFGVGMDANIVSASLKAIVSGLQRAQSSTSAASEDRTEQGALQ